jgi:hypothetical protein
VAKGACRASHSEVGLIAGDAVGGLGLR